MRCRWWSALAIVVAPALAQEKEEPEVPLEEMVEEVDPEYMGRLFSGERDAPAVCVRVREGGALTVKVGEEWQEITLEALGTFLMKARDDYDAEQKKAKKPDPKDGPGARIFLSIDAEPTVPWQHVQWLMTTAAEQKVWKLEMSEGKRRLITFLPRDLGCGGGDESPLVVKASVHILARAERPAKWGDLDVQRPTDVRFKCGDKETADLADVTDYLRKAKKACEDVKDQDRIVCGEIKAGHKVPYGKVFDVMETFVAAKVDHAEFYGTAIPPRQVRQAQRLPYPLKNYETE